MLGQKNIIFTPSLIWDVQFWLQLKMTWTFQGVPGLRIKKKVTANSDFISVSTLQFSGSETK